MRRRPLASPTSSASLLAPVAEEAEEAAAEVPPWGFALLVVDEGTACGLRRLSIRRLGFRRFWSSCLGRIRPGRRPQRPPPIFGPSVEPAEPPADCFSSAGLARHILGIEIDGHRLPAGLGVASGPGDLTMGGAPLSFGYRPLL